MKFDNLFNSRDKSFVRISEAADYLSRSLRENLTIFEINDSDNKVTFLSEKNSFITCEYGTSDGKMTLSNFVVESLKSVTDDERIDQTVSDSVTEFVSNLSENRFDRAENTFEDILESLTSRHRIKETRAKLSKKAARFSAAYNIVDTPEFKKLSEVTPMLDKFITENKETLKEHNTLMEGMRLSYLVSEAYDLPKLSYDDLSKAFIVVPGNSKKSLYEMICEKELVRKELLESKEGFSRMWVGNEAITALASCIYATDPTIVKNIKECVKQVPYFALASKSDVYEVLNSVYEVTNPGTISQKDIREYVAKIFETKKPFKQTVLNTLNEKYGINMQNLKFIPSFKGLSEVYSQVMTILAESAGEGVLHDVCVEFGNLMKKKGGVEVLDVAAFLQESFERAGVNIITKKEDFGIDALTADIQEQYAGDEEEDMDLKDLEKKPKKKKKKVKVDKAKGDDTEGTEPGEDGEEDGEEEEVTGSAGAEKKKKKGKKIEEKADNPDGPGDKNNIVGGAEPKKGKKLGADEEGEEGDEESVENAKDEEKDDKKKKKKKKGKKVVKEDIGEPSMENDAFDKAEYAPEEEKPENETDIKELVSDLENMLGDIDLSGAELESDDSFEDEEEPTGPEGSPA
tara:strand:+ start:5545 stop:7434 length:1890 start_codon:yes stop_codon:yes gene_type:complete